MAKFCQHIFLILLFKISFLEAKYDCNEKGTVYVNPNEITFFETTNFPALMTVKKFLSCNLSFSLNSSYTSGYEIYVAIIENGIGLLALPIIFNPQMAVFNTPSYSLTSLYDRYLTDISQSGFILFFESKDDKCPLEALSPLKIIDETQIIFLLSSYNFKNSIRTKPCNWEFIAPDGYGFKVVVVANSYDFIVRNQTQVFLNERQAVLQSPVYNSDSYIHIYLGTKITNVNTDMNFQAYISIVKKDAKKTKENCNIEIDNNIVTWGNNLYTGLKDDMFCSYNFILPKNYLLVIEVMLGLENDADYIKYFIDDSNSIQIPTGDVNAISYMLFQTEKNSSFLFEFVSDGSLRSAGFNLVFTNTECKCAENVIPCDGSDYSIMPSTFNYCANLNCSFTILPCPTNITFIELKNDATYHNPLTSIFTIKSNGENVLQISADNEKHVTNQVFLNSLNTNIFEAVTYPSFAVASLRIHVSSFEKPNVDQQITLSPNKLKYIMDTGLASFILFDTNHFFDNFDSENYTFEIYSNYKAGISIYNNESLSINLSGKNW